MKSPYEAFGIECGPGWRSLYEPLIVRCKADGVEILQVKEKFGVLCFYVASASDDLRAAIAAAERQSTRTCEQCGAPGRLYTDGWLRTACLKHRRR